MRELLNEMIVLSGYEFKQLFTFPAGFRYKLARAVFRRDGVA
jgi:hypothetical protein